MKLRRSRRAAGPSAAHNSRYGPRETPTITAAQRDAVYRLILGDRLSRAADLSLLVEQDELCAARRLASEVADDLQLVLDGLGWGKTGTGVFELALPAEQLQRTFTRLRESAVAKREASSRDLVEPHAPYERAVLVIETCDQVLAVLGSSPGRTTG
jgi:hypothetical protein